MENTPVLRYPKHKVRNAQDADDDAHYSATLFVFTLFETHFDEKVSSPSVVISTTTIRG